MILGSGKPNKIHFRSTIPLLPTVFILSYRTNLPAYSYYVTASLLRKEGALTDLGKK